MLDKLKKKRAELESQLLSTELETKRIDVIELELNSLLQQRQAKESFNAPIHSEIAKIDEVITYLIDLDKTEE